LVMSTIRLKQDRLLNKMTMVTRACDERHAPTSSASVYEGAGSRF
jgi:hypothetical protein